MKSQFVSYEIALALKELGFDEKCMGVYHRMDENFYMVRELNEGNPEYKIFAPLWQQIEEWFREKHHLFINVLGDGLNGTLKGFYYSITEDGWINWYESVDDSKWYDTYEEAREAAILEAIKLVKEKTNE
jgi:hypothetical protein